MDQLQVHIGLVLATGAIIIFFAGRAWFWYHDSLHPAIIVGIPLLAVYCIQPLYLFVTDSRGLYSYLKEESYSFVLICNLVGCLAFAGSLCGIRRKPILRQGNAVERARERYLFSGLLIGSIGLAGYLYGIYNVGGFRNAYGRGYGGGWSDVGYLREAYWLGIPAIMFICLSAKRLSVFHMASIALVASPLLLHGLLGGRRGPTGAIFVTLFLSRSIYVGWRPKLWQLLVFAAMLGALMLALVTYRDQISLAQSDRDFENRGLESYATKVGISNEFVYGAGVIVASHRQPMHFYGGRYITFTLIRPIPKAIFPGKYQFAADMFGIKNLEEKGSNGGTGDVDFYNTIGWLPTYGSAPGVIADMWLEFSYYFVIPLLAIGTLYRSAWARAVQNSSLWQICYIAILSLSIYLVTQALDAMLFRFLLILGAVFCTYMIIEGKIPIYEFFLGKKSSSLRKQY